MKRSIVIPALVGIALFTIGFLVGRQFPSHHYVQQGSVILDTGTGVVETLKEQEDRKDQCAKFRLWLTYVPPAPTTGPVTLDYYFSHPEFGDPEFSKPEAERKKDARWGMKELRCDQFN